jgi:hypothetical protein
MFQAAYNEYVDIGKNDDQKNLYETYSELYPGRSGSMIPFSVRFLYPEILFYLGKDPNLEASFSLLNFVSDRFKTLLGRGAPHDKALRAEIHHKEEPALVDASLGTTLDPLSSVDKIIGTGFVECDESMFCCLKRLLIEPTC